MKIMKIPLIAMAVGIIIGVLLGFAFLPLVPSTQSLAYWLLLGIGTIPAIFFLALFWEDHASLTIIDFRAIFFYGGSVTGIIFAIEGIIITFVYGNLIWGFIGLAILAAGVLLHFTLKNSDYGYYILGVGVVVDCALGVIFGILSGGGLPCVLLILFLAVFSTMLIVDILVKKLNPAPQPDANIKTA